MPHPKKVTSSDAEKPAPAGGFTVGPLGRALNQNEQVLNKVQQAGVDLSSVNAEIKDDLATGASRGKVKRALEQNERIEADVQEAATELASVNDALAEEVDERHHLEHRISKSDAALSESQAKEERSRHRALHDPITGLPNLTLFNDRLSNALAQAQRHAWRLAVMFIDLDAFKTINDTHGHDFGDRVLQTIGQRLEAMVRGGDTLSRRSGDEFLFLMLEAKNELDVTTLAARILENIAEPCEIDGVTLQVNASIGLALYPEDGRVASELLKNADLAMYVAKQEGKGWALHGHIARPWPV